MGAVFFVECWPSIINQHAIERWNSIEEFIKSTFQWKSVAAISCWISNKRLYSSWFTAKTLIWYYGPFRLASVHNLEQQSQKICLIFVESGYFEKFAPFVTVALLFFAE